MGISFKKESKIYKIGTLFIGNIVSLLIGLITAPIITRLVDTNEYGQVSFFTMYTNIFLLFSTLGLERAYIRHYHETETSKRRLLLFECVKASMLIFAISIPIVIILFQFTDFEVSVSKFVIVAIFIVNGLALTLERFSSGNLRIQQKSTAFAISSVMAKVIYGLLAVLLVLTFRKNEFLLIIISTTTASLVTLIYTILADRKSWNFHGANKIESPWPIRNLLRYSLPLMFQGMITIIFQSADKLMIKHYGDYSQTGIYASAGYFLTLCNVFVTAITTITGPEMFEYHAKKPKETKLFSDFNQMMSLIVFCLVFTIICSKDLLVLLLGENYCEAGNVMPFLMIGVVMTSVAGINSISIEIKKKTGYNVLITAISAIANIIGNYFLIPALGIKGAAISTGSSYILFFILTTIISKRILSFKMYLLKYFCVTVLLVLFAIYRTFYSFSWIVIAMYIAFMGITLFLYRNSIIFILVKFKGIINKKGREQR